MSYRIVNLTKDAVEADFGEGQLEIATKFADRLAEQSRHREQFAVVQMITVYATGIEEEAR
jgi:hypothetical protein